MDSLWETLSFDERRRRLDLLHAFKLAMLKAIFLPIGTFSAIRRDDETPSGALDGKPPRNSQAAISGALSWDDEYSRLVHNEIDNAMPLLAAELLLRQSVDEVRVDTIRDVVIVNIETIKKRFIGEITAQAMKSLEEAKSAFDELIRRAPSIPEYADFMKQVYVPAYNAVHEHVHLCFECAAPFALMRKGDKFCSEKCGNARRSRERNPPDKVNKNKAERFSKWFAAHQRACTRCGGSNLCEEAREQVTTVTGIDDDPRYERAMDKRKRSAHAVEEIGDDTGE